MRFSDELRGSEGERCIVTDLRTGTRHEGTVLEWDDVDEKAVVRYDGGLAVRVSFSFVQLLGDEKP